jgi:hypothetical protein
MLVYMRTELPVPVYCAAPYAGDVMTNVAVSGAFGAYAVARGFAPVVPHMMIFAGIYGNDDIPEERERGMKCTLAIVVAVAHDAGELWVLRREDGTISPGCLAEIEAYSAAFTERYTGKPWVKFFDFLGAKCAFAEVTRDAPPTRTGEPLEA